MTRHSDAIIVCRFCKFIHNLNLLWRYIVSYSSPDSNRTDRRHLLNKVKIRKDRTAAACTAVGPFSHNTQCETILLLHLMVFNWCHNLFISLLGIDPAKRYTYYLISSAAPFASPSISVIRSTNNTEFSDNTYFLLTRIWK